MDNKTKKLLLSTDAQTLAEWYCELNRWGWPPEIPDPEERRRGGNDRRRAIMRAIHFQVGEKLISRVWNSDMTDAEHEAWWRKNRRLKQQMDRVVYGDE